MREYEVLLYLRCASKNTFWYIFGFYSFYNIACYVWCSTLNRPTSYNTPRSSKTNLDLQERFSCATRAQGDESLNEQEQVGRRPKRGGAAFASVDIWALWGLELGAWPQTFSFWWGPDHIFIKTIGFGSSNTSISWNATFFVTLLPGIWKDQLLYSNELHNRDINGTELSNILAKRDSFVHHLKAKAHNKISITMLNGSIPQSNVRQRKEQERVTNQNQLHLDWLAVSLSEQKATFLQRIKPAANQFLNVRSKDLYYRQSCDES